MGSRGRGTLKSVILGSVSTYIVQHSPSSVLVARGDVHWACPLCLQDNSDMNCQLTTTNQNVLSSSVPLLPQKTVKPPWHLLKLFSNSVLKSNHSIETEQICLRCSLQKVHLLCSDHSSLAVLSAKSVVSVSTPLLVVCLSVFLCLDVLSLTMVNVCHMYDMFSSLTNAPPPIFLLKPHCLNSRHREREKEKRGSERSERNFAFVFCTFFYLESQVFKD